MSLQIHIGILTDEMVWMKQILHLFQNNLGMAIINEWSRVASFGAGGWVHKAFISLNFCKCMKLFTTQEFFKKAEANK